MDRAVYGPLGGGFTEVAVEMDVSSGLFTSSLLGEAHGCTLRLRGWALPHRAQPGGTERVRVYRQDRRRLRPPWEGAHASHYAYRVGPQWTSALTRRVGLPRRDHMDTAPHRIIAHNPLKWHLGHYLALRSQGTTKPPCTPQHILSHTTLPIVVNR